MFRLGNSQRVLRRTLTQQRFSTTAQYIPTIGLEVHAQIQSTSKLFSGASTQSLAAPNTQVALCDMALPGALPIINRECVAQAVRLGIATRGQIHHKSRFDRKHYFYCDMPQGYQITQHLHPIVTGGVVDLPDDTVVKLERIQLEQDSGKNIHDLHPLYSFVDLNRAGVGLLEIVSEPCMHSAEQARSFVTSLQSLLVHLDICSGIMAEGAMRCDVNVSIAKKGDKTLGERVEIKNLSSLRAIVRAIQYEIERQQAALENGDIVKRETRGFDVSKGQTVLLRTKEQLLDYRFLPEPDLPPLVLSSDHVTEIEATMPELPSVIRSRFIDNYGLSPYDATVILSSPDSVRFYESVLTYGDVKRDPKIVANWLTSELFGRLTTANLQLTDSPVTVTHLSDLIDAVQGGMISGFSGKKVLDALMDGCSGDTVAQIIKKNNWELHQSNDDQLTEFCQTLIDAHPAEVADYHATGNKRKVSFLIATAVKQSKGKANPKLIAPKLFELLKKK